MQRLLSLYQQWQGAAPASFERLAGAGSNRIYYRLTAHPSSCPHPMSVIGCIGTSREENHAFITLARHFTVKGLPVPTVLAVSDDELCYLQTDLGNVSLFDALSVGRNSGGCYNGDERKLLRQAMTELPRMQFVGAEGLDFSVCYPQPVFNAEGVMFDLNYFKYCFLKATGIDFHEVKLEQDFRQLTEDLLSDDSDTFLYRDFQARNIMLSDNGDGTSRLTFIDFQGGRRGPIYYDVASFLWQASARYPSELRQELIDVYYTAAQHYGTLPPRHTFDQRLQLFVFFRILQVLGAYGFRGYFERKQHFIDSIPPAIDNLRQLLATAELHYPTLTTVLRQLCERNMESQSSSPSSPTSHLSPLQVTIYSFSYKKGIPADDSGHGGGYVFDCRGTHNPGRYEQYKQMTGLDEPVIRFLEDDGEILTFLDNIYHLADAHVQRYLDRGFTNLMFCFGCTGGQHRSVYSAQHLAEHIKEKFPAVHVHLCHREQNITNDYY